MWRRRRETGWTPPRRDPPEVALAASVAEALRRHYAAAKAEMEKAELAWNVCQEHGLIAATERLCDSGSDPKGEDTEGG